MCGIAGFLSQQQVPSADSATEAARRMHRRGPDAMGVYARGPVLLSHARLSIIDTDARSNQPFTDASGRYTIVFNGEIFNYRRLHTELELAGHTFATTSDTEVLLYMYIHYGSQCLHRLNGFFSFAVWDDKEQQLFVATDRYGEKPLVYTQTESGFAFASEIKALRAFCSGALVPNKEAMRLYLHLNYIPAPLTFWHNVHKLLPGHCMVLKPGKPAQITQWYNLPVIASTAPYTGSYADACRHLVRLMEEAVDLRLAADVPLGSFLSGGIDSSVVTGLAARQVRGLHSFSVGYADDAFFDETDYARMAAKKFGTEHTVFMLSEADMLEHLEDMLDILDEPFADSSALAVYILSKKVRPHVTVALSGDGADEMFSGYMKHSGEWRVRNAGLAEKLTAAGAPLWKALPQSRQTPLGNMARRMNRFAEGMALSAPQRYRRWCGFADEFMLSKLIAAESPKSTEGHWHALTQSLIQPGSKGINDVLLADCMTVLPGDMLVKVDRMSMANSLEVRAPFMDYRVMEFAHTLPSEYKLDARMRKKIVQDAFRDLLPEPLYNRSKKGFEVPLLKWLRNDLNALVTQTLNPDKIAAGGLLNAREVSRLLRQLHSSNPGDAHARVWALFVMQRVLDKQTS